MTVANPSLVWDLAVELLAAAEQALTDNGIDLPDRRFVTFGEVVDDVGEGCDGLLAVTGMRIFTGTPGQEVALPEQCGYARTLEMLVRIVRCVHPAEGDEEQIIPTTTELEYDARTTMRDVWVILQGLIEQHANQDLYPACQRLMFGNASVAGPSGGVGGWQILVQVQLD